MSKSKLAKIFFVLATISAVVSAVSLMILEEVAVGVIIFFIFLFNVIAAVCCDGKYKQLVVGLFDLF